MLHILFSLLMILYSVNAQAAWMVMSDEGAYCSGSSNEISQPNQVKTSMISQLRKQYQNCTKVFGNIEITHVRIDPQNPYDTLDGIFDDIEEVTGYVTIYGNNVRSISLPRLKIIWGDETLTPVRHSGNQTEKSYSYALQIYGNPRLEYVDMRSLRAIHNGDVVIRGNTDMCYRRNIDWFQLMGRGFEKRLHISGTEYDVTSHVLLEDEMAYCPKTSFCHPSCTDDRCWGPEEGMCQQVYRQCIVDGQCDNGCFSNATRCCHMTCLAGCTGPTARDCVACAEFNNDGECVDVCPLVDVYNQKTQTMIKNPLGKYSYIRHCVDECPAHTVTHLGNCLAMCPDGYYYDEDRVCEKCRGACPKTCSLPEGQPLDSDNVQTLVNCTILEGNLEIREDLFSDRALRQVDGGTKFKKLKPLVEEDLQALQYLQRITGFVLIETKNYVKSLTFLRNLEVIEGRKVKSSGHRFTLQISSNYLIMYLKLKKLTAILQGDVMIIDNRQLCLADSLPWETEILKDEGAVANLRSNRAQSLCLEEKGTCSEECEPSTGCWSNLDSTMCFSCRHKRQDGECVRQCQVSTHYEEKEGECVACDDSCDGCNGPTNRNCTRCAYVKHQGACYDQCPANHFEDDAHECRNCSQLCFNSGCTGPGSFQGDGGCNKCRNAIFNTTSNTLECLDDYNSRLELCARSGFADHYAATPVSSLADRVTTNLCKKCHVACKTCENYGDEVVSHGCQCADGALLLERRAGVLACVETCDSALFYQEAGHCRRCHAECADGCLGPATTQCQRCRHVMDIRPLPGGQGHQKPCVPACPSERPFNNGGVCGDFDAKEVKSKQDRQKHILIGSIICTLLIVLFVVAACCFTYRRKFVLQKFLILPPEIDKADYFNPDAKPNMANLRLINEMELRIDHDTVLGSGAFGIVYAGIWKSREGHKYPVAIKELQDTYRKCAGSNTSETEMLEEAGMMASQSHPHLLPLIGVCLSSKSMMLVTPFMPLGSVLDYMDKYRDNIGSYALLLWCRQIAEGMEHLERTRLVHRDLAARNVLVYRPNVVKVTDFGLAKMLDVGESEVYVDGKVPIKWLAIESIRHKLFTHKSDVWAFGVTVWELLELGRKRPYEGTPLHQIPNLLESGTRLDQPACCTMDVFMVMIKCWMVDADSRPTFNELRHSFDKFLQDPRRYLRIDNDNLKRMPSMGPSDRQQRMRDLARLDLDDVELSDYITNDDDDRSVPTSPNPSKPLMGGDSVKDGAGGRLGGAAARLQSVGSSRYQSDPANKFMLASADFHDQSTLPATSSSSTDGGANSKQSWLATDKDNYLVPDAHAHQPSTSSPNGAPPEAGRSRGGSMGSLNGVGYLQVVTAPDGTPTAATAPLVGADTRVYYNDLDGVKMGVVGVAPQSGDTKRNPGTPVTSPTSAVVQNLEYLGERPSPEGGEATKAVGTPVTPPSGERAQPETTV